MRQAFMRWVGLGALVATVLGCNQAQPPVNRVQPNVVEKATFADGEWYFLQTVIDTPYSATYTFVGEQGPLEKIVWEVQEQYLIARRSYEHIDGSEGEGISGASERGAAVAMYRIESHFDIRREYSPTTGEEINVIVENSYDRPWHEREFMRVDWSQNLITNSEFLVLARIFDGIQMEPVSYYVQESDHPHAPKFVRRDGESLPHYVDIVNKMFVRPKSVHIDGFGDIPSCYLLSESHLDCAPGEITVRNSFLKVDPSDDYQPQLYSGDRMERFGYFVTERAGYDDHYGPVEPARFRFANRHDIWEQSFERDASGALVRCTESNAESVCGGGGSVCDTDYGRAMREREGTEWLGACTIPYRERVVKPIRYYVSRNFPESLIPDAQHAVHEWNGAFAGTVASLRVNECLANGGDEATCEGERERSLAEPAYVLCHNPVAEGDHASCGAPGTVAEIGDLRYSLLGWVNEPHSYSPLGYGPSAADPETGEIIMGNAFVYGAGVESLSTFARDIIALLNRDVTESSITSGELVEQWVDRMTVPGSEVTGRPADDHAIPIDGFDVERIAQAMDFSWAHDPMREAATPPRDGAELHARFEEALEALERRGAFGSGDGGGRARLLNLRDTDIEARLTNEEMRLAAGVDPFLPLDESVLELASPLRGMSMERLRAMRELRSQIERQACILNADFADEGLLGLARSIKRAADSGDGTFEWYGQVYSVLGEDGRLDYEAVRDMLIHPIFDAVLAHEIGHTLGLRHNFSGSYDSLNYHPTYWELRDDGHMAPRAWDPMTEAEIDGRIREYQYSTVMDYGNNFVVTDSVGIGHYDHAAIKMGYGDLVEVFTNAPNASTVSWIHFITKAGWPVPLKLEAFTGSDVAAYAYTEMPGVLGGRENLEARADVPYESLVADPFLASQGLSDPLVDAQGRPAVPFLFCSDESADLNPDCQRYDAGADQYESLQSVIDTYWNYYVFNAYARGRLGFNTGSYAERIHDRYFAKLQHANQIYALYRGVFGEIFGEGPALDRFFTRQDGMGAYTAAVGASFNLLTRVVTAPEPGSYARTTRGDGSLAFTTAGFGRGEVSVDGFDGRYLETTWNFDAGYYWFDQIDRAGYYYDKIIALEVLVDPQTYFLGRDTAADVRRYQISFYNSFRQPLTSFLRGLNGEDWTTIAPRVGAGGELVYPDPLEMMERDMPGEPLDPNASFTIQLFAAAYGMALIPDTFDRAYLHQARIFRRGGPDSVELDPSVPIVTFTDPQTGIVYVAASYRDASGRETGVGAQMLQHAQRLADRGAAAELSRFVDNIEVVERLSWLIGYGG